MFHTLKLPPTVFLLRVITPAAWKKFLGSSVNFPTTEVSLKRGLKRAFFWVKSSLSNTWQILSSLGKCFFLFLLEVGGDGEDSTIEGKVGRFLALPFCPDVSILAGKAGADCLGLFCSALTRLSLILNYIRLLFLFFHISFQ